jgi:hypothetical protein
MRTLRLAAAFVAFLAIAAIPAHAQLFRTYLTLDGDDANPCTLPQPCRLLPAALAAVATGGEIWMLDSANYNTGPVSVTKSVTILAIPGALGSVVALGGNALDISTTGAVTLRNLNILPFPGSANFIGVNKNMAGTLLIQDSNLFGFTSLSAVSVNSAAAVSIARSVIRDNGIGVVASNGASVGISDALFTGNTTYGVSVIAGGLASPTTVSVTRTVAYANETAFFAVGTAGNTAMTLRVVDSRIECSSNSGTAGIVLLHATSPARPPEARSPTPRSAVAAPVSRQAARAPSRPSSRATPLPTIRSV